MTIDERIEALTMNLELAHRDIQDQRESIKQLQDAVQKDGENIRQLALIAQSTLDSIRSLENTARAHGQRLDDLAG
jgi:predicted  nucleic acid-binding Zn-ribbon protein